MIRKKGTCVSVLLGQGEGLEPQVCDARGNARCDARCAMYGCMQLCNTQHDHVRVCQSSRFSTHMYKESQRHCVKLIVAMKQDVANEHWAWRMAGNIATRSS